MKEPVCTFCGQTDDRQLVDAYPGRAYICLECANLAATMLRDASRMEHVIRVNTTAQGTGLWR